MNVALGPTNTSSSESNAIPQLDARLDSHTITNADIVFNKDVVAQVTVLADNRSGQDTAQTPEILVQGANLSAWLYDSFLVNENRTVHGAKRQVTWSTRSSL